LKLVDGAITHVFRANARWTYFKALETLKSG